MLRLIGSSPIRQYAEGWSLDYLQKCTEDAITFAVGEGLTVNVCHRGHDAGGPRVAAKLFTVAVRAGAQRLCVADTGRALDAQRRPGGGHVS